MASARPTYAAQPDTPRFIRGLLSGFIPLASLVAGVAVSLVIAYANRLAFTSQEFAVQQPVLPLVLGVCLVVTISTYTWAMVRTWRQVRVWRQVGEVDRVRGALWAFALTGILIFVPFVLALIWPQSPAVAK